jgi:cytochrome aa3-600 menaquinol oxidase subunit 1
MTDQLLVHGDWMITMTQIGAPFAVIAVIAAISYFKFNKAQIKYMMPIFL